VLAVRNRSALDTAWLEQLVDVVRPEGLAGDYLVEFLLDVQHHGFAYPERRTLRVWIARECTYPLGIDRPRRRRAGPQPSGPSPIVLRSLEEAVLFVAAHELRHLWQAEHGRLIAPGVRYLDERDANAYGARALRRHRRRRLAPLPMHLPAPARAA
jgi:hypothetical protein